VLLFGNIRRIVGQIGSGAQMACRMKTRPCRQPTSPPVPGARRDGSRGSGQTGGLCVGVGLALIMRRRVQPDYSGVTTMPWSREDAEITREMIKNESDLINHRLTWVVTLNGFLFATLGFAWKDGKQLLPIIAILGMATSLSILFPLGAAQLAIDGLVKAWDENKPLDYQGPDIIGHRTKKTFPHANKTIIYAGLPWFLLPILLIIAWSSVLFLQH
jgi:hypothetical protein